MRKPKTLATYEERTTINQETGEITEQQVVKQHKAEVEPSYIKLYLEDIAYFNGLNIKSDLLYELLRYVNYEQEIVLNKTIKGRVAEKIGKSLSYVNNQLTNLVNEEVLIRVGVGVYQLNTYLFGKGSWKDILKHRKSLHLEVFYSYQEGRTIKQN